MPSPPEFARICGKIRQIKVQHDIKTHDFTEPPSDTGIPCKITKYLERKGIYRQQNLYAVIWRIGNKNRVYDLRQVVCDKYL